MEANAFAGDYEGRHMAHPYTAPIYFLGSGEVRDRYYKEPPPLSWWDKPQNVTRVAFVAILVLLIVAAMG